MDNLQPWRPTPDRAIRKPANLWARWLLLGGPVPASAFVQTRQAHVEVPLLQQVAKVQELAAQHGATDVRVECDQYYDPSQYVEQDIWQLVALGIAVSPVSSAPAVPVGA